MALELSGSINISGSMTATTIIVSSPGVAGMVSSSAQITELAPLMAYTSSLKGAAIVSSSQQITNYYKFAETASANTFYGNQSISGTLTATTSTTGATIKLGGFTNYGTIQDVNDVRRIWFENVGSYRTIFDLPVSGSSFAFRTNEGASLLSVNSGSGASVGTGDLTITNGNLVIGTSGKGIDFSATSNGSGTMTSELLNDYEEGTWTPTNTNVLTATGVYTKIGRLVTVQARVVWNGAGTISLNGLPFTTSATVYAGSIIYTTLDLPVNTIQLVVVNDASSTYITGYTLYDDAAAVANPVTKNGTEVHITLQYSV